MASNIAIVGSGPAGITLARLLYLSNIHVTLFEGEASADVRTQGGTLDLHMKTGIAAVKECGLYSDFLKHVRYDGEASVIADKQYRMYLSSSGSSGESKYGRPEIDRQKLRDILLASLPTDMVKWGMKVTSVKGTEGDYTLHFENGTSETGFDLIVGADGAFSKVRPVLSDVTPEYSGIGGVWGSIADAENRYPELHKTVNKGSFFSYSDGKSITAQQIGDGSLYVSVVWVQPADWVEINELGASDHAKLHEYALKEFTDWDPRITALFEAVDYDSLLARNLYMLPVGTQWQHKRGITLIGDAAHLMTPYAGEGVNLALVDSQKLAHAIIKSTKSTSTKTSQVEALSSEIRTFEEEMFKRATQIQRTTFAVMNSMFFIPGAPYTSIEQMMYAAISDGIPAGTRPLVKALIISYFGLRKKFFLKPKPQ